MTNKFKDVVEENKIEIEISTQSNFMNQNVALFGKVN